MTKTPNDSSAWRHWLTIGGLTYCMWETYDGEMKKSVTDLVYQLVLKYGAITESKLIELIPWPEDTEKNIKRAKVRSAILYLLAEENIIWTGGLPKQGVFFKQRGKKGFGIPLMRASGHMAPRGSLATKRKEDILDFLIESHTTQEVADEFEVTYLTAQRALKSLEDEGHVSSQPWRESGRNGRPPLVWMTES